MADDSKHRPFWLACMRIGVRGTAPFANDWQWAIGNPTIAAITPAVAAGLATWLGKEYVMAEHPILGPFVIALGAYIVTWVVAFAFRTLNAAPQLYNQQKNRADNAEIEIRNLKERIRPKLRYSFRMSDPGCVRPNTTITWSSPPTALPPAATVLPPAASSSPLIVPEVPAGYTIGIVGGRLMPSGGENMHTTKATYYRIKVEADNVDHVSSCQGRLVSIEKAGKLILEGEPITLPFAPSERSDAISKTIHKDAPEYLDFLAITDDAHSTSRQQLSVFAARSIKFPVIPKKFPVRAAKIPCSVA